MDDIDLAWQQANGAPAAGAVGAASANPDQAAQALDLSRATGAPAPAILNDLDSFKTAAKQQAASALVQGNPQLQQLTRDPMHAQVTNDDLGKLDQLSQTLAPQPTVWSRLRDFVKPTASDQELLDSIAHGFDYEGRKKEFSDLYNYVDNPAWHALIAATAPITVGATTALGAIQAGFEGGSTFAKQLYNDVGGEQFYGGIEKLLTGRETGRGSAEAFGRDVNTMAQVAFAPEAHLPPELQEAARAAQRSRVVAQPFVDAGKVPPTGVDPIIDAGHQAQNQADLAALKEALGHAQESTTRERAPEVFKQFVEQHVGDETIGLNHDAVREMYGASPPEVGDGKLGFVPDLPAQMLRSAVTGQDILVRKADWLTHVDPVVAQELEQYTRVRPEGVTDFEAQALAQKHTDAASVEPIPQEIKPPVDAAADTLSEQAGLADARPIGTTGDYRHYEVTDPNNVEWRRSTPAGDELLMRRDTVAGGKKIDTFAHVGEAEGTAGVIDQLRKIAGPLPPLEDAAARVAPAVLDRLGISDVPTYTVHADHPAVKGALGMYYPQSDAIVLRHTNSDAQMLRTMVHESYHAAFMRAIDTDAGAKAAIQHLMDVADATRVEGENHYGLTNPHEFISEAFSKPTFQEFLSKTKLTPEQLDRFHELLGEGTSSVKTLWDAFLQLARKAFGLKPDDVTALDAAFRVGDRLTALAERERPKDMPERGPLMDPVEREGIKFADTRGQGAFFHGTSAPDFAPTEGHYTTLNYYGQGMYTTDAADVAYGYSKRGSARSGQRNLHQVWQKPGVKLFDGEAPLSDADKEMFKDTDGYIEDAAEHSKNLREMYDFVREEATTDGYSANEVQEIMAVMQERLEQHGYRGFTHKGGLKTGAKEHTVNIYFNPEQDLNVSKNLGFDAFKVPESQAPMPESFSQGGLASPVEPEFDHAAAVGMSQKQYLRYRELIEKQRGEEVEARNADILADERRKQTKEWKSNEVAVRKEVADEYPRNPAVMADTILRGGEKLDTDALSAEQRAALGDAHSRGGIAPDDLARQVGFDTGDELVSAVAQLREARGAQRPVDFARAQVEAETQSRMEQRYGNLDKNVVEAAKDRVLSQTQMDLLHLDAQAQGLPISKEALAANVRKVVGEMPLSAVNSDASIAAAGRAGRAMEAAHLAGDAKEAFAQRMRQINHLLAAKEMVKVEKARDRFAKTMKTYSRREVPGASQEFVDQMHELMVRLGQPVRRSVQDIRESIDKTPAKTFDEFVSAKEGLDGDPRFRQDLHVPDFLRDPNFNTKLNDLTADQFAQVDRAFKALVFNARNEAKVIRAGEKVDYANARDALLDQLREVLPGSKKPLSLDNPNGAARVAKSYWWSSINLETMFNRFDRDAPLGVWNQTLVRSFTEAAGDRERMLKDYNDKVRKLGDFGDMDKLVKNELFRDPESGQLYEMKRRHVLGVLQNVGNASNMRKLSEGYGITPAEIMDFLARNTTKEDWDRAQKIGDLFGELFEKADDMSRNVSGVGIEKLPLEGVSSPHGQYAGWYNPVAYDKLRGEKTGRRGSIDDLEGGFYKATTPQGYTKSRTGYIGQMQLNLDIVPVRMKQMIHDITTRESVMQLGKFFYDPKFKNAIRDHYGVAQAEALEPFLRDFANAPNFESDAARQQDKLIGAMSSNMVTTAIGLNPGTVLKHGLGALGKSLLQQPVGFTKALASVLMDDGTGKSNWARALELSDECKRRMRNFEDTVTNAGQTISLKGGEGSHWKQVRAFSQYISGWPIGAFDMLSSVPTFLASYDRAIAEGHDVGQAQFLANRDVRTTHGSSILTNRPEIARSRSAMARTFSGFYGVFSENLQKQYQTAWMLKDTYNLAREGEYAEAVKNLPKLAGVAFTSTLMMALVEHAVDSDDKSKKESWAQYAADLLVKSATSSFIGIRDLSNSLTSDRDPGGNLLSGFEKTVVDPLKDMRKAVLKSDPNVVMGPQKAGKFLKHVATMTAALSGIGNAQLGRMAQFTYNYKRENPRGPGDIAAGLWHGTLKDHRKGMFQ